MEIVSQEPSSIKAKLADLVKNKREKLREISEQQKDLVTGLPSILSSLQNKERDLKLEIESIKKQCTEKLQQIDKDIDISRREFRTLQQELILAKATKLDAEMKLIEVVRNITGDNRMRSQAELHAVVEDACKNFQETLDKNVARHSDELKTVKAEICSVERQVAALEFELFQFQKLQQECNARMSIDRSILFPKIQQKQLEKEEKNKERRAKQKKDMTKLMDRDALLHCAYNDMKFKK